jgi:hypothetical protein
MLFKFSRIAFPIIAIMFTCVFAIDINPYGFVRFNGVWSDGVRGSSEPNGMSFARIPETYNGIVYERANRFDFSASQTTFGINSGDSAYNGNLVLTGKFEGDFIYGYRLNHGLVDFSFPKIGFSILFGKTFSLFAPCEAPTINYRNLASIGNLSAKRPQIRLTQKLGTTEIAVAARKDENGDYPAVEGRIGTMGKIKIGTSAFWATEKEAGISYLYSEDYEPASWGIAADLFSSIGFINISGEFFMGQNLSSYGGISNSYYHNYVKYGIKSMGGWGALGLKASENLNFNAGLGLETITRKTYWEDAPWFNRAVFANINYNITPAARIALEYFRHDTSYMNHYEDGSYNRVETSITYGF